MADPFIICSICEVMGRAMLYRFLNYEEGEVGFKGR